MVSLVRHLHAFVRDVRLTEVEFREATAILNEIGKLTTDTHNEAVLMAGSLGVSGLVCLLNNGDRGATETSQSLLGPFWRLNSPWTENGASILRSQGADAGWLHVKEDGQVISLKQLLIMPDLRNRGLGRRHLLRRD